MKNIERPEVIEILVNYFTDKKILSGHVYVAFKKEGFKGELFTSDFEEWANAEFIGPYKITKAEKCILESLKYDWLARDSDDELFCYDVEPVKKDRGYAMHNTGEDFYSLECFENIFPFITFENGAINKQDILNNCEVVDDAPETTK